MGTGQVLYLLLVGSTGFCTSLGKGSDKVVDDRVDPGTPLFLTPLIESGQLDLARKLSRVEGLPTASLRDVPSSYSGYLTVNKTYNSNLFFWYFPAQVPKPSGVPILLWLQGGPGASSLLGLFFEHGPFVVTKDLHLQNRDYPWTTQYHMLYVDQPAGTGFSFTENEKGFARDENDVADNLYKGLQQFFTLFPDLQQSDFYVTGESYGGKYVPAISYKLHKEKPDIIRFRGMAIGNGMIDPISMMDYGHYLYQLGLVDENQRQYFLDQQDKARSFIRSKSWLQALEIFNNLMLGVNTTSFFTNITGIVHLYNFLRTHDPEDQNYYQSFVVLPTVRKAIHVGNQTYNDGSAVKLHLAADIVQSTAPLVAELMDNYKVMIYNGQLDVIVAYPLTANFLWNLQWTGLNDYRKVDRTIWKVAEGDDQVAGYVRQVGKFYQVLVRDAGHMVPYDQPRVALDMITRFINGKPFNSV